MKSINENIGGLNLSDADNKENDYTDYDELEGGEEYYDDGGEYAEGEEGYDDGYYDDYDYADGAEADDGYAQDDGGDKLDRVLDELAAIRYSVMGSKGANQDRLPEPSRQPSHGGVIYPSQPVRVYTPNQGAYAFSPNVITLENKNEHSQLLFNELSQLRNELTMTQNRQEMHLELTRLKEEMARETKANEQTLLEEIRRLNQKIENMQRGKT
jgi:hypothetical protein